MFDMLAYGGNPTAWIIILLIVVLLFGASRIPEMMRGLGSGMREFKKGLKGLQLRLTASQRNGAMVATLPPGNGQWMARVRSTTNCASG